MFYADTIYVQLFKTKFIVQNVDSGASIEVARDQTFASPRMIIADFTMAEHQLKQAVKNVRRGLRAPEILIHPMELIEGGITQVEYRTFVELGIGSGASKVGVYSGASLSPDQIKKAIREYKH
ncbi:hypothetical protein LRS03_26065 [Rhizobacter sp. J219]|uniref:hypothetical protein n=1 Tax=Rhizobacter sp. J219 TaxID=2898430 RepID=UPI002150CB7D|nr:hypothetical protein [Rhizobacter sp. J219]MCR5886132.1 hypothetical protein [Rhizobacter sp. J219]